ncbi:MAG: hypothetical protein EAZ39_13850 [Oscillatoriales cyanobacterium]|nr:hypothetical protein C7B67_04680 [filamentous cyanobacterium Phorm 6]TAG17358.1 MAG: hypothetical protein EAZ39_13850 [Oscillatoriales cyanobacterium]TAG45474.1 MAG: hypothetical protein EAZ33_07330 [Oscillatoriales cyanobacterium]TAG60604.1 MAG: hypothetical protein EAZ28_06505 [Oscillatoriales cyanobacterium]
MLCKLNCQSWPQLKNKQQPLQIALSHQCLLNQNRPKNRTVKQSAVTMELNQNLNLTSAPSNLLSS